MSDWEQISSDPWSASPPAKAPEPSVTAAAPSRPHASASDSYDAVRLAAHRRIIRELDVSALSPDALKARQEVESAARAILSDEAPNLAPALRQQLVAQLADEVLGLGPIEALYADPTISEIMVNAPNRVYIERDGRLELTDVQFRDADHIYRIIERIVAPLGRRIDESSPMVDARLPDGSRVNAVISPLTPKSPSITIRKFRRDRFSMDDLAANGALSPAMAEFLRACAIAKKNVLISGGTGAGKTTLLNAYSEHIPATERIVTIEDPMELQLKQDHVITLEARPAGVSGAGAVTQRDLVRNSLRMRPDRIIVGEVRGGEAFDMLQAMNTGHEGSISTVHANTPRDALSRVENMVLMAALDLPARAIREQIASAIHLIVQVSRYPDGGRRVSHITEVDGMEGEVITTQDIFLFRTEGYDAAGRVVGLHHATGLRPGFVANFERQGVHLPPEVFAVPLELRGERW